MVVGGFTCKALKTNPEMKPLTTAEAAAQLEEDIVLGRLVPRERLIEDDLMRRFGLKRHQTREILSLLQSAGLVVREKNRGAMVRWFTRKEIENLYEVREILESGAIGQMAMPVDPKDIADLQDIHGKHCAAVETGDLREVFHQNIAFHQRLYSLAGNEDLSEAIEAYTQKTHACRSYTIGQPEMLVRAAEEHGQMIAALRLSDRAALARLVVDHMKPAREAYLRKLQLVGLDT